MKLYLEGSLHFQEGSTSVSVSVLELLVYSDYLFEDLIWDSVNSRRRIIGIWVTYFPPLSTHVRHLGGALHTLSLYVELPHLQQAVFLLRWSQPRKTWNACRQADIFLLAASLPKPYPANFRTLRGKFEDSL